MTLDLTPVAQRLLDGARRVKLALEKAGIDMPEPICRVQLHQASTAAETKKQAATTTQTRSPAPSAPVDTRANTDVQQQIDNEQQTHPHDNLLDPTASRE